MLANGESAEVIFKYKNTGNVTWNARDVVFQTLPAEASSFAAKNWISPLCPTVMKEKSVAPGEIGTFQFTVVKNSRISREIQTFVPVVRGLGRIRGRAAKVEIQSASRVARPVENQNLILSERGISSREKSAGDRPLIRIKLAFESDRVEIGGGSFAVEQFGEVVFRGNFADFKFTEFADGEYFRIFPEGETVLEIPNFTRLNWNGAIRN